jgi:hypothetical protein
VPMAFEQLEHALGDLILKHVPVLADRARGWPASTHPFFGRLRACRASPR